MPHNETNGSAVDQIRVEDYEKIGRIVVGWMRDGVPIPRSGPIQDLVEALGGAEEVGLPASFTSYEIVDGSDTVFRLRLPPPNLTEEGEKRACKDLVPGDGYGAPEFYREKICKDQMNHCNFFFCRVADYTMNMCK